jgi:hypothetical protein
MYSKTDLLVGIDDIITGGDTGIIMLGGLYLFRGRAAVRFVADI